MGTTSSRNYDESSTTKPDMVISNPAITLNSTTNNDVLPMPPEEDLEKMFDNILDDLNLSEANKANIKNLSQNRKWLLVQAHLSGSNSKELNNDEQEVTYYLESLKNDPSNETVLRALVVCIRSKPIKWVNLFLEKDGLEIMVNSLEKTQLLPSMPSHTELKSKQFCEELCVQCLKSLLNNKIGLQKVLTHETVINVLFNSIRSFSLKVRSITFEIISVLCCHEKGHSRLIDSLENFTKLELIPYSSIVECLDTNKMMRLFESIDAENDIGLLDRVMELHISCLTFLNSLLFPGHGKDINFRLKTHGSLTNAGLASALKFLSLMESSVLKTQIGILKNQIESDEEMLAKRLQVSKLDLRNVDQTFEALKTSLHDTEIFPYLVSIMGHLCIVPNEEKEKLSHFWEGLEHYVRERISKPLGSDADMHPQLLRVKSFQRIERESLYVAEISKMSDELGKIISEVKDKDNNIKILQESLSSKDEQLKSLQSGFSMVSEKLANLEQQYQITRDELKVLQNRPDNAKPPSLPEQQAPPVTGSEISAAPTPPPMPGALAPPPPPMPGLSAPPPPPMPGALAPPPPPMPGSSAPPPPPIPGSSAPPPPPIPGSSSIIVPRGSVSNAGPPPPPIPNGPPPPPVPGGPPPPPNTLINGHARSNGLPTKKQDLSSKPMKNYNWIKIPNNKIENTIWKGITDEPVYSKIDQEEFENLFVMPVAKPVVNKDSADAIEKKSNSNLELNGAPAKKKELTVLDPRRAQNCNIFLKTIKLSPEQIRNAIINMDAKVLDRHVVSELVKFIPSDDELVAISAYENELENLAAPEKYLWNISKVPNLEKRLKAIMFKCSYDEYYRDIEQGLNQLNQALTNVEQSSKWRGVLQVILAMGNYMNSGSRGGAYGFRLTSLQKLVDTKSSISGRKYTLLHYLVDMVDKKFPIFSNFYQEMTFLDDGAKVAVPTLRQYFTAIRDGNKQLGLLLEETVRSSAPDLTDRFQNVMGEFHEKTQKAVEKLESEIQAVEKRFEQVVSYYGEDPKNTTPEEFFNLFIKFIQQYKTAKDENILAIMKAKEEEKRAQDKKSREEQSKIRKASSSTQNLTTPTTPKTPKDFDAIINSLKSGQAFERGYLKKGLSYDSGNAPAIISTVPNFSSNDSVTSEKRGSVGNLVSKFMSNSNTALSEDLTESSKTKITPATPSYVLSNSKSKSRESMISSMKTAQSAIAEEILEYNSKSETPSNRTSGIFNKGAVRNSGLKLNIANPDIKSENTIDSTKPEISKFSLKASPQKP